MPQKPQSAPDFIPYQEPSAAPDFIPADKGEVLPPPPQQPMLQKVFQGAKDLGIGVGRGVANTTGNIGNMEHAVFPSALRNSGYGKAFEEGLDTLRDWAVPANTMQAIGKGAEQVGEFFVPGGAEADAAKGLVKAFPAAEKAAPLVKALVSGVSSGAVNKAQGGSFGAGAAMGGGGSLAASGLKAAAPALAESALNIRKLDRAYKQPSAIGRAILDETSGFRPGTVADSAQGVLRKLNPELENAANNAATGPMSRVLGTPNIADLRPAQGELQKAFNTATRQGERTTVGQLEPMQTHLAEDIQGNKIQPDVTPRQLLDLKRGFGNEFIHRWNPETMEGVKGTAGRTYHQLAKAFEDAVPEAQPLNRRIGALIPVAKRGESAELNAPTVQRAMHRIAAHTGAGIGAITGGYSGYEHGGAPGAILGGATGLLLPELATMPATEMAVARGMNSALTPAAVRAGTSGMLQLEHKGKKAKDE